SRHGETTGLKLASFSPLWQRVARNGFASPTIARRGKWGQRCDETTRQPAAEPSGRHRTLPTRSRALRGGTTSSAAWRTDASHSEPGGSPPPRSAFLAARRRLAHSPAPREV